MPSHSSERASVCRQAHQLGWSLIRAQLEATGPKNMAISSWSITIGLAMVTGGADPDLKGSLVQKLGLKNFDDLGPILASLSEGVDAGNSTITIANALFTDARSTLFPQFIEYIAQFKATTEQFENLSKAANPINRWVATQTHGLIQDLLTPEDLVEASLALVNALAFKGKWEDAFERQNTVRHKFNLSPNTSVQVEMMLKYGEAVDCVNEHGYYAVRLPYQTASSTERTVLIAYLPNENSSLQETLAQIGRSQPKKFHSVKFERFGFPKFTIDSKLKPFQALLAHGYPLDRDFTQIVPAEPKTIIKTIVHRARVDLDEEGTVAVAATAIGMAPRGLPPARPTLIFERPFAFSIVTEQSGVPLFTGVFMGE